MKTTARILTLVMAMVATGLLVVCCTPQRPPLAPGQRVEIQTRVTNTFAHTVLFQLAESGVNRDSALGLAPLIVQEVADTNTSSLWRDQFAPGTSGPMVHSESGNITVNGRPHDQYSYWWIYPSTAASASNAQGIRLTLNAAGEPVIWEVLHDSSGADLIYVAQSLELAARAEFGPPLPGRRFAIERAVEDAPNTVVANVIDDGPVPMGPVVYLRQGNRDVAALICRCMASQGGTLHGQAHYELRLAPGERRLSFPIVLMERRLRFPHSF